MDKEILLTREEMQEVITYLKSNGMLAVADSSFYSNLFNKINQILKKKQQQPLPDHSRSNIANLFVKIWNENCGTLTKVEHLTKERVFRINELFRLKNDVNYWTEIVKRISKSSFCKGINEKKWVANFDWFLREKTHILASEGQYDDAKKNNQSVHISPERHEEIKRMLKE